jgi:serine/threonine-protein kinase
VLAPLPRKPAGGGAHDGSRDTTTPGWDSNEVTMEATVRALPDVLSPLPKGADPAVSRERTDSVVVTDPGVPGSSGLAFFFKSLTILMLLAGAGFFAWYFFMNGGGGSSPMPYRVPGNAPVQTGFNAAGNDGPLYDQPIVSSQRNVEKARKLELEADRLLQSGRDLGLVTTMYQDAFQYSGDANIALKLGDLYWHRGFEPEARGWWERHLREAPNSKARALIEQRLRGAVAQPSSP